MPTENDLIPLTWIAKTLCVLAESIKVALTEKPDQWNHNLDVLCWQQCLTDCVVKGFRPSLSDRVYGIDDDSRNRHRPLGSCRWPETFSPLFCPRSALWGEHLGEALIWWCSHLQFGVGTHVASVWKTRLWTNQGMIGSTQFVTRLCLDCVLTKTGSSSLLLWWCQGILRPCLDLDG